MFKKIIGIGVFVMLVFLFVVCGLENDENVFVVE